MAATLDHTFEATPMYYRVLWGSVFYLNAHTDYDIRDDCTSSDSGDPQKHSLARRDFRPPAKEEAGMRRIRSEPPAWDRILHFHDLQARRHELHKKCELIARMQMYSLKWRKTPELQIKWNGLYKQPGGQSQPSAV